MAYVSGDMQEIDRLIMKAVKSYDGKTDRAPKEIEAMLRENVEYFLFQGKSLEFIKVFVESSFY